MRDLSVSKARLIRFGPFELDVRAGELRKHGIRIKLREQPLQILLLLLEQPGEVVLREEIRLRLWPNDTIVEFDHGINAAIQRLRDALAESAGQPRYVETVARRGYRFLGKIEKIGEPEPAREARPQASGGKAAVGDGDLTGQTISHYRVLNKLGSGGMGVVYRAEDLTLGRQVAIKLLPSSDGAPPESMIRRFAREARAASALNHPNICTIYGFEDAGGQPLIVMELVEGETLASCLAKGPLPLPQAIALSIQIVAALGEAHSKGVVHRDLKPANIMLTRSGVKVLDFGLAKIQASTSLQDLAADRTTPGAIMGSLHYLSPEQARGKEADESSDVFAFGLTLFEMLAGRHAFDGDSAAAILTAILEQEAPSVADVVPASLNFILSRCLAKNPQERWQSARDLGFALAALAQPAGREQTVPGFAPGGSAPDHESNRTAGSSARSSRWLWAAAITLGVVAGGGTVWLARGPSLPIENPLSNAQFTRLADFEGVKYDAALSPDGRMAAFRADRDGPFDVWLTQIGSGQFTNLTHGSDNFTNAQIRSLGFSGDGSEIWLGGHVGSRLRLMPLMGGTPRFFLREHVLNIAWSPDGAHIVYHTNEDGDPMFIADRNGENPRRIFIHPGRGGHAHFPTWSPDGRWIYVSSGIASALQMDLWRIPVSGGQAERLTHHNNDVEYPTPIDVRTVLYTSPDQDGSGPWLWALDVERKVTRHVSFGLEQFKSIAASADGRRLVATVANPSANLWSVPILDRPVEERDVKPFSLPALNAIAPHFGPGALFYLSSHGSGNGLWRYQDGQAAEIWKGSQGALVEPPGVSPDGRQVAIAVSRDGKHVLHVLSSDGAELQPLAPAIDVHGASCWSSDGQWIVVGGNDERGPGLFKIPVGGGTVTRLVGGTAINPVWSADRNLIVYVGAGGAAYSPLLAVRPDGAPVQLPAIRIRRGDGERARFLPGGRGLVYMQGLLPSQDFWLLDLSTNTTRQLTHLDNRAAMRSFDISPDGKQIVFDRLKDNSDIVLIELRGSHK
jgi:serine/threonine protein kinase/Tol biopolymer transport system component